MPLSESDTRAKLIDPALHARGWTEDLIRREETAGAVEVIEGQPRKRTKGRVDYTLRVKVNPETQPVAVALIGAKAEHLPPAHGLEQAKLYAVCKRLNVPFVFSSNGHLFVKFDRFTGPDQPPAPPRAVSDPHHAYVWVEPLGQRASDLALVVGRTRANISWAAKRGAERARPWIGHIGDWCR